MNESLLNRILKDRKRRTRSLALILCLSMIVSLGTFAGFHKTAIAKVYTREVLDCPYTHEGAEPVAHVHNDDCYEGETLVCTLPEREAHMHNDTCYAESRMLSCGLEENPGHQHFEECFDENGELTCQIPEGEGAHVHTDACYTIERALICNQPELPVHVHDAGCFRTEEITVDEPEETAASEQAVSTVPEMPVSDPDADLETADDWNREFENLELSGNWARDLVLVAATQQGRGESPNNFEAVLNDAGDAWVRHGYTRYGAWYGYPYAEWDAMFVSFCLRYAGIPEENVPNNPTAAFMAESFSMGELFAGRDYVPVVGDLIFFDTVDDEITNIDHMGIVYHVDAENGTINTVEGDRTDAVATFGYYLNDEQIVGYGILPQNPNYIPAEGNDEAFDGFIFMTTDEDEETEETTDTKEETVPAIPMPAQSWERTAGGIKVSVEAPEGAFPENTKIAVTPVNGSSLMDTVSDAVSGEVLEVQAVDITFFDAEGHEIEPAVPIRVVMTPAATEHAEEKANVVHVDIAQQTAELIEQAEGTEADNSEVVFDAEAFTIYAIVYTVDFEYEVNGTTYTASIPGAKDILLSEVFQELDIKTEETAESAASAAEEAESPSETDSEQEQEEKLENPATKEFTAAPSAFKDRITAVSSSNIDILTVTETENDWLIRVLKNTDTPEKLLVTLQDETTLEITVEAQGVTEVSTEDNSAVISTVNDLFLPESASAYATVLTEEQGASAVAAVQAAGEVAAPEAEIVEEPSAEPSADTLFAAPDSEDTADETGSEATFPDAASEIPSDAAADTVYQVFDIGLTDVDPADYSEGFQVTLQLPEALTGRDFHLYHLHDGLVEEIELNTVAEALEDGTELVSAVSFVTPSFSEFVLSYRQLHATLISAGGETWEITVTYDEGAGIPDNATLQVREILPEDGAYQAYYQRSMEKAGVTVPETVGAEATAAGETLSEPEEAVASTDTSEKVTDPEEATQISAKKVTSEYIRIFDIEIWADEQQIEPTAPVTVSIRLLDAPQEAGAVPQVVHFAKDGEELMELKDQATRSENGDILFTTDEFSVYSVMYTVDFLYEINGNVYSFAMQGADSVSLRALVGALHVYEKNGEKAPEETQGKSDTAKKTPELTSAELSEEQDRTESSELDAFMKDIVSVTFSNPDLLVPAKVKETTTVGKIKTDLKLFPTYPLGLSQEEVLELNAREYTAGDWVLISVKAFDTQETLTIEMATGEAFTINVTDAQNAQMIGDVVQTISNPAGTTIDLFDYWIISQDIAGRDAWGDLNQSWGRHDDSEGLNGSGNNKGINSSASDPGHGHALKFSPAWEGTVFNGTKDNWTSLNTNGRDGLNSYTGNGNPFQGIVQGTLQGGFPVLTDNGTIGSNGESLAYLFDPGIAHNGKASYPGVDQLLYVDPDGYYTYDSRDYRADFSDGTFTLTEQTSDNTEIRGFWPFGTQNFWVGMHVNTQFSMPVNGQVLNPRGEYKDMQFEFSGDDDTWLYIDGVLVGDGGGIHNRTEIDINFAAGTVTVTGRKDSSHLGDFEETKYLDDIFQAAGAYNEADWEDIGDGSGHKRFKAGTYHTFDMFYLERGGGESNLYIHYNLVSTADFTAHKSYKGYDENDVLLRNQFRFELIGLDGKYRSVWSDDAQDYVLIQEDTTSKAIMPHASGTGAGTTVSPYYNGSTSTSLSDGSVTGSQTYITGNTEDGNVNFGHAEISEQDMHDCDEGNPPVYRYIVRETVPDDAVNADNITWADATDEQRAAGGFKKDSVIYDGTVYYMTARVTSWLETDAVGRTFTRYGLSKTYYTDDTYTTKKADTQFIDFRNRYMPEFADLEFDKVNIQRKALPGAVFGLFRDSACKIPAMDGDNQNITATSNAQGKVSFTNVRTGIYFLKEISAPEPYEVNPTVYRATISTQGSHMSVNSDQNNNIVTEVVNTNPGDISVIKKWIDQNGKEVSGEGYPATVQLRRYHYVRTGPEPQTHNVTLHFHFPDAGWNQPNKDFGPYEVTGNSVVIHWNVGGCKFFWDSSYTSQITDGSGDNLLQYPLNSDIELDIYGNQDWASGNLNSVSVDGAFDDSKELRKDEAFPSAEEREKATHQLTNEQNMWAWSIGTGDEYDFPGSNEVGEYLYYVVELDANENAVEIGGDAGEGMTLRSIVYNPEKTSDAGITHGLVTVTNQLPAPESIDVVIWKTDEAEGSKNYLSGAVFKLEYRADSSGSWVNATTLEGMTIEQLDTNSQFTVPDTGIKLTGLINGQYRLKEVSPPKGYVIASAYPVMFTAGAGAITNTEGTMESVTYTAATEDDAASFTIPNFPGIELPQTGGIGTTLFTALGGLMTATAGAILTIRRKRKPAEG